MKKFYFIFLGIVTICFVSSAEGLPTLADKFSEYSSFAGISNAKGLMPLLLGETIRFSDFDPNNDINYFEYIVPDTVWIKERPKKNPKEGKHYILRYLYHSELYEDYDNNKKTVKERTPAIELVGAQFLVNEIVETDSISPIFEVYLSNIATGEEIVWFVPNAIQDIGRYVVHLTELSNNLNIVDQNVYYAEYANLSKTKIKNGKKFTCTNAEAIFDFRDINPFKIMMTAIDGSFFENKFAIPFAIRNRYQSNTGSIWLDETQYACALESNKVYKIDYILRLTPIDVEFPFSFRSIVGEIIKDREYVGQTILPSDYSSANNLAHDANLTQGDRIFIGDKITVRGEDFYKAVKDSKPFYIRTSGVNLSKENGIKLDSLMNSSTEVREAFFIFQKALSYYQDLKKQKESLDKVSSFSSKGISIPSWGVYDESEYTSGTGVRFTFHNPTEKTIKYINLSFVGYNTVDDRVGKVITKKCIGPIEPDEMATYTFEYVWLTDIIEYAKLTSLSVQYKDGTNKKVTNPNSVVWSDALQNNLSDKSPLEKLKFEVVELEK